MLLLVADRCGADERVNRERTSFDIQTTEETEDGDLFGAEISLREIRDKVLEAVRSDLGGYLESIDAEKLRRIDEFVSEEAPHYRILLKRRDAIVEKIAPEKFFWKALRRFVKANRCSTPCEAPSIILMQAVGALQN